MPLNFDAIYEVYPEAVWLMPRWLHVPLGHPGFAVLRREIGCELAFFTEHGKVSDRISEELYKAFVAESERKTKELRRPFEDLKKAAASGALACGYCACEDSPEIWLGPGKWFAEKPPAHAPGCPNAKR